VVVFLALRAFASGCTALTGVEAISNGVPAFRKPKSRNAANTLGAMGIIALTMFAGVTFLAIRLHVHYVDQSRASDLVGYPTDKPDPPRDRADGRGVLRRQQHPPFLLRAFHPRDHPGARRHPRLHRLPRAGIDPRAGLVRAPPAAHARRPPRLQQ